MWQRLNERFPKGSECLRKGTRDVQDPGAISKMSRGRDSCTHVPENASGRVALKFRERGKNPFG